MVNILNLKEACAYLKISKSLLYKLTSSRRINFTKPNNGKLYFKKEDLDAWLMQNEHKSIDSIEKEMFK